MSLMKHTKQVLEFYIRDLSVEKHISLASAMRTAEAWATTGPGSPKIETGNSFSEHNKTCIKQLFKKRQIKTLHLLL